MRFVLPPVRMDEKGLRIMQNWVRLHKRKKFVYPKNPTRTLDAIDRLDRDECVLQLCLMMIEREFGWTVAAKRVCKTQVYMFLKHRETTDAILVRRAHLWTRLETHARLVGRMALALLEVHDEVSCRPGNTRAVEARRHFYECAGA